VFVVFSGLPGVGKTSVARELARVIDAVYLRIDSIEQAVVSSGVVKGSLDDAGYRAARAVAVDNLRLGRRVIADAVNPWMLTRDAFRDAGLSAGAQVVEVEVVCTDLEEHRARIEARVSDIPGLRLPDWEAVMARDYRPWEREPVRLDTAGRPLAACVRELASKLGFAGELAGESVPD